MNAAALATLARRRLARALARVPELATCCRCRTRPVTKYRKLGVCLRCYMRHRRGSNPARCLTHAGPCRNACGRPGRGRSGLCKVCYGRGWHRRWRWQAMLKRVLGTDLTLDQLGAALRRCRADDPEAVEALRAVKMLLWETKQGHVYFSRHQ
ncbi:MAG TPA: hypothetical protein DCP69_04745 [Candidatus Omnitrophica bacterium]|nr:hypothetical protein [Candidatus Omnitrophota bacterium]